MKGGEREEEEGYYGYFLIHVGFFYFLFYFNVDWLMEGVYVVGYLMLEPINYPMSNLLALRFC